MKIQPLHDRILVERIEAENKTKGGIIIPDTAQEKPAEGLVLAVGKGNVDENGKRIALDVKVGDRVLFTKWGGTEVKIDGKEVVIMKESDVLAIINK
ncbi:MAG: groS [Rickettsiaceae bacterium]|jgi:chaperonin GroES|nr:groS [Rickettsiaceae bacterium]